MSEVSANRESAFCIPELLAPAGDWECAKAAVENGADAIYFGLDKFNARMRAHNFTEADLPKLMEFLHGRGVKGYVTFTTLIFANEMAEAEQCLRAIIAAGIDAAIVQDVGVCRLIRRLSPDFPIHASTQMTITSACGVEFARELGCHLVVLARECSLKEIERIQTAMTSDSQPSTIDHQLPLEVFVHGALCVAYSGQCLTSEALGGRSANRGECAQACRMPYELISDGKLVPLGDRRYLLSPQDLAGLNMLPELIRAGVASLKIEGRLKSPEYVANITRIYRQALDDLRFTNDDLRFDGKPPRQSEITNRKYEMEMAFSRGLYTGWFCGSNNQELVHARFGKKRGVYLGEVTQVGRDGVVLKLEAPLKPGDGVVFDAGRPDEKEEGGRVYEVRKAERGVIRSWNCVLAGASSTSRVFASATSYGRRVIRNSIAVSARVSKETNRDFSDRLTWSYMDASGSHSR
jgi:putative protease